MMCAHTRFSSVEQVGVIAALAKLHEDVKEPHLVRLASTVHDVNVLHQDLRVPGGNQQTDYQSLCNTCIYTRLCFYFTMCATPTRFYNIYQSNDLRFSCDDIPVFAPQKNKQAIL